MDGMLSQEEINALLNNMDSEETGEEQADTEELLSSMEKDIMGELSNISMGTAATTLSSLVNQKVDITTPSVESCDWDQLVAGYDRPCVMLQISYKEGLDGNNIFILKDHDVKIIADLMMGGDGTGNMDGELTDLHLSAISEAMNQMMGSASTSLSSMINAKIDISPPTAISIDMNDVVDEEQISPFLKGRFVKIAFKMTIGTLVDSEIMQLFPAEFCKTLCNKFGVNSGGAGTASEPAKQEPAEASQQPAPQPVQPQVQQQAAAQAPVQQVQPAVQEMPMQGYGMPMQQGMPMYSQPMMMPMAGMPMQNVNVQQAQFQAFSPEVMAVNQKENIDLIMDVPLEVTVELGRTKKSIQDILEFAPGTIIELNKIAGEPIDVLVNGKYVAKGEVVVIEESFGVRVTEIIKN